MNFKRALFITHHLHIGDAKGGVQRCTAEYIETIKAIGWELQIVRINNDQRFDTKVLRRLNSSPYFRPVARSDLSLACNAARQADVVFLNQVALSAIAQPLRNATGSRVPIIALSHGCEITDMVHLARLWQSLPLSGRLRPTPKLALAQVLADEIATRAHIDGVIGLSEYDSQTETWLGAARSTWLPRVAAPAPLAWSPVDGRFGFVGTLDHAPSLEGLVQVLDEIEQRKNNQISIRIVGAPARIGEWLAQRYASVTYLGALNDSDLIEEAKGWSAFLNPIFCQARGCSTKLAMALNWQIPVITTTIGRRGYVWEIGGVSEANTPRAFVHLMSSMTTNREMGRDMKAGVQSANSTMPNLTDVSRLMNDFCFEILRG